MSRSLERSVNRIEHYLRSCISRERTRIILSAFAWSLVSVLLVTAVTLLACYHFGYLDKIVVAGRGLLVLAPVGLLCILLWWRLHRLSKNHGLDLLTSAEPRFEGRLETYVQLRNRRSNSGFKALLANDNLDIARKVVPAKVVPASRFALPAILLVACALTIGAFFKLAGPELQRGVQHVYLGWRTPGLVEPRTITLSPGDQPLLYGNNLDITAAINGFRTDSVVLHAKLGNGDWEQTALTADENGRFNFTVFRVVEPIAYFATAGFTTSEQHQVEIVIPATLLSLQASYQYPDWTRLPEKTVEPVRQITGVEGTRVSLRVVTDKALAAGSLQLQDRQFPLITKGTDADDGIVYQVEFSLEEKGKAQMFDQLLGQQVPLGEPIPVKLLTDEPPEITFIKPARDVSASPVEEVTVRMQAEDDFAIESLSLMYSVNAGDWQSVSLPLDATTNHTFSLESLGKTEVDGVSAPLAPGDLISYYATVEDRASRLETDMMLIEVRPFNRRFSQSQSGAGAGGGQGQANDSGEISKRQREMLVATWNLLRASQAPGASVDDHADNALLLSELQTTLADQAIKLAERTEARELVSRGDDIREFVELLRNAAGEMQPSAEKLSSLEFEEAIQPQQKALQYLQQAEAIFSDFSVNQQQGNGQGGQAGQDIAEMFELEMDLAKNQYEQPESAAENNSVSESLEDIFDQLAELAKRQQALEESARENDQLTQSEQWQQERLKREAEELRRQLEQLERQVANNNASGESSSGQSSSGEASSGEPSEGEPGEGHNPDKKPPGSSSESLSEAIDTAKQSLEQATRAMEEGGASDKLDEQQTAIADANRKLRDALAALAEERSRDLTQTLNESLATADDLLQEQRDVERSLRRAAQRSLEARKNGQYTTGLSREQERELAEQKRSMQRELDELTQSLEESAERHSEQSPQTTDAIREALDALEESQTSIMLGIAGDAIEEGSIATVLPGESIVTNELRDFRDRLDDAEAQAGEEIPSVAPPSEDLVADAMRQLRGLRNAMRGEQDTQEGQQGLNSDQGQQGQGDRQGQQGQSGQQGQQGQSGQQGQQGQSGQQGQQGQSGQQGQQGQSGQQGQQGQSGQQGQQGQSTQITQGGLGEDGVSTGVSNGPLQQGWSGDSAFTFDSSQQTLDETADAIDRALPTLKAAGISEQDLEALRDSASLIRAGSNGVNAARLETEFNRALETIEQLELVLSGNEVESQQSDRRIRKSRVGDYEDSVSDYFESLSEDANKPPN